MPVVVAINRERVLIKFGRSLADLRRQAGLTQEELAANSGLHRTYVGSVERGERNPTIVSLVLLARGLGVSMGKLVAPLDKSP